MEERKKEYFKENGTNEDIEKFIIIMSKEKSRRQVRKVITLNAGFLMRYLEADI